MSIDVSTLSPSDRQALLAALIPPTTKTVKPSREIVTDVKIRMKEEPVLDESGEPLPDIVKKVSWLSSPRELVPGSKLFIQTRKPWPAHVQVEEFLGMEETKDGERRMYKFSWVPRETTRREGGSVKITTAERVDALAAELAESNKRNEAIAAENARLLNELLTSMKKGK